MGRGRDFINPFQKGSNTERNPPSPSRLSEQTSMQKLRSFFSTMFTASSNLVKPSHPAPDRMLLVIVHRVHPARSDPASTPRLHQFPSAFHRPCPPSHHGLSGPQEIAFELHALIPMAFMLFITGGAMLIRLEGFYAEANWLLFSIELVVFVLEIWMIIESVMVLTNLHPEAAEPSRAG